MPPEIENHPEVSAKVSLPAITARIVETYEECGECPRWWIAPHSS